jgi:hypothetical protein
MRDQAAGVEFGANADQAEALAEPPEITATISGFPTIFAASGTTSMSMPLPSLNPPTSNEIPAGRRC